MTRPLTGVSPRCHWCGKLAQFCEDPTGHELALVRERLQTRTASALLQPDAEVLDVR